MTMKKVIYVFTFFVSVISFPACSTQTDDIVTPSLPVEFYQIDKDGLKGIHFSTTEKLEILDKVEFLRNHRSIYGGMYLNDPEDPCANRWIGLSSFQKGDVITAKMYIKDDSIVEQSITLQ